MGKIPTHKKQSKALKKKRKDRDRAKKLRQEKLQSKKVAKDMQNRLDEVQKIISMIPESCTSCGAEFDNNNESHLDGWEFSSSDYGVSLKCDTCKDLKDVEKSQS